MQSGSKSKMIGGRTLLGRIATFMDNLHISYDEAVNIIPYRNMVIMSKDKMHEASGDIVHRVSGKEMAGRRNKNK
jgi:hypothetical protein